VWWIIFYSLFQSFCTNEVKIQFLLQPEPDHGVYTVFVKLGNTKIEVSIAWHTSC